MKPFRLNATHEAQLELNSDLQTAAADIVNLLGKRWKTLNPAHHLYIQLFNKAYRTFRSIHILIREESIEDGLCLLRVLAETTINVAYAAKIGPAEAARSYWDWALLDAIRRRRDENRWKVGTVRTDEDVKRLLEKEQEIKTRRSPEEIEAFKRKGVFGVSLEERARVGSLERIYRGSYRITSRNTHAIDVIEMPAILDILTEEDYQSFFDVRLDHLLSVSQVCLGMLAGTMNSSFKCGMDARLALLKERDIFPVSF